MYAKIQPTLVTPPPVQATILVIANVGVNPGSSAGFTWLLYHDATMASVAASGSLSLTGDAYTAWGSNDEYLYTYTAAQLGLTIIEIVPDAPAAPVDATPAPVDPS